VVRAHDEGAWFDGQVVDEAGRVYLQLDGYRVVPLPEPRTLVAEQGAGVDAMHGASRQYAAVND
jgi:hypothetical protein